MKIDIAFSEGNEIGIAVHARATQGWHLIDILKWGDVADYYKTCNLFIQNAQKKGFQIASVAYESPLH